MTLAVMGGAHPRVCGENAAFKALDALDEGSSPRVRGKPHVHTPLGPPKGLIPACAGKTLNDLEF